MRRLPRAFACLGVAVVVAATALAQVPATTATKPPSLAKFIPAENLGFYLEFRGTDAVADAWGKTAASKVLSDTTTGAMLEDILTQAIAGSLPPPREGAAQPTAAETVAILKHIARSGMAFGVNAKAGGLASGKKTLILPGVMRDDVSKKAFTPLIRSLTPPGGKSATQPKPGGRTVIVASRADGSVSVNFWLENKTDLIVTDDPDAVIAAFEGKAKNAEDHPRRAAMVKADAAEEALAVAWIEREAAGAGAIGAAVPGLDTSAVKELSYRLAMRGSELVHEAKVVVPKPRSGALALFDGPKFDLKGLPPLPEGVIEFNALSLDFAKVYGQVVAIAKAADPSSEEMFKAIEATVTGKTKLRLREDVLGRLGPKVVAYVSPVKKATGAAGGLLSNLGGGGFQVPKGAALIEIKDPKAVTSMLDQLMLVANKEFRAKMGGEPAAPAEKKGSGRNTAKGKSSAKSATPANPVPEFKVALNNPKTYSLNLPTALAAMTNLRLTLVVGKKHLIVATMPDAAKEALTAESKPAKFPPADVAEALEGLPSGLLMLDVSDPRDSLPEALAKLPEALTAAMAPKAIGGPVRIEVIQPPQGGAPPGGEPGQIGGGRRPGGRGGGQPQLPSISTGGGPAGDAPAGAPASTPPAETKAGVTIQVDPSKIPPPDSVRKLIAPGAVAVAVDDQSIRLIVRHSFPDLGFWASLPTMASGLTDSLKGMTSPPPAPVTTPGTPPAPPGQAGRRSGGGGTVGGID